MFASLDKRCAAADVADIVETLKTGWLAPGKKASALELETAQKCGKAFGLLVNSHKSAVFLACIACRIGEGVNVLVPSVAPKFHLEILRELGATVHFVDIDSETLTLSANSVPEGTSVILLSNLLSVARDFELKDVVVIEDLGADVVATNSNISIVSFDGLCSVAAFDSQEVYNRALGCRDWGRVGDNDEDVNKRYDGWVLGKNVKYDNKFVYGHLGFNLKSCEMSAGLALRRLRDAPARVDVAKEIEERGNAHVARNGHSVVVESQNKSALVEKIVGAGFVAKTLDEMGFVVADGEFPVGKRLLEKGVVVMKPSGISASLLE